MSQETNGYLSRESKEPAPTVKVYGYSDDLVAIEGSRYKENEIGRCEENAKASATL